jgi:hypothetical protein
MSDRPQELGAIRSAIIDRECPVLITSAEAAAALDIGRRTIEQRYENCAVADGRDRFLIRRELVRANLLAMRPKPRLAVATVARTCKSCGDPLPSRSRGFCSRKCSSMTPSARARLAEERAKSSVQKVEENSRPLDLPTATDANLGVEGMAPRQPYPEAAETPVARISA